MWHVHGLGPTFFWLLRFTCVLHAGLLDGLLDELLGWSLKKIYGSFPPYACLAPSLAAPKALTQLCGSLRANRPAGPAGPGSTAWLQRMILWPLESNKTIVGQRISSKCNCWAIGFCLGLSILFRLLTFNHGFFRVSYHIFSAQQGSSFLSPRSGTHTQRLWRDLRKISAETARD